MLLENLHVNPEELPQTEESDFHPLEQDYLYMRLTAAGLFFFVVAGICIVLSFTSGLEFYQWTIPWVVLLALRFFLDIRGFRIKGYAIRSKDVSYKTGLIFYSMTTVPFNRIQHCEISQGPIARLFDLASVKVYTAGGSSSDITINGLEVNRAQQLRDYITRLSSEYD